MKNGNAIRRNLHVYLHSLSLSMQLYMHMYCLPETINVYVSSCIHISHVHQMSILVYIYIHIYVIYIYIYISMLYIYIYVYIYICIHMYIYMLSFMRDTWRYTWIHITNSPSPLCACRDLWRRGPLRLRRRKWGAMVRKRSADSARLASGKRLQIHGNHHVLWENLL